ncbi:hypothetical protein IWW38_004778, partial [Coemansia aciculifera]
MRLPFSIHKGFKSSDNFVQLAADDNSSSHTDSKELALHQQRHKDTTEAPSSKRPSFVVEQPRRAGSPGAARDRGMSTGSYPRAGGRPLSALMSAQSPTAPELHFAQIEEELDTIMDSMGLQQAEQRLAMKNMSVESKVQLIHTHKTKLGGGGNRHAEATTPLSEHLKILTRAGAQSLPRARLEKLRVDIAYQSMKQLNAFIDDGGLRLLLTHLAQLNERKTASRRQDELQKEREILCCILGMAKVGAGAKFLLDGSSAPAHLRHILDSVGTLWLPCSVMSLRIVSYLVQQNGVHSIDVIISSLFRREAAADDLATSGGKRSAAFVEWMQAIDHAIEDYEGTGSARGFLSPSDQQQSAANAIELVVASLALVTSILDALSASIDKRIKFYERLHGYGMLAKFAKLRAWRVSIINSLLGRWDEALRRDYNIARSQRSDAIMLDTGSGGDSTIRDMALFKSFVAHYQEAKAIESSSLSPDMSDADDEFLHMNLSTYANPTEAAARSLSAASAAESPASS